MHAAMSLQFVFRGNLGFFSVCTARFDSAVFICAHLNASKTSIKIKLWVPVGLLITIFFSRQLTLFYMFCQISQAGVHRIISPQFPRPRAWSFLHLELLHPAQRTLISWSSKWIQMRLVRPPGLNGPLVYTLVRQLSGESGPRYPQRRRDVLKTHCRVQGW